VQGRRSALAALIVGARTAVLLAVGAVVAAGGSGEANASYAIEGRFVASEACAAFQSFRRQTNPGAVALSVGAAYPAVALNRAGGDHVLLEIPEASPNRRWVALACGRLDTGTAPRGPDMAGAATFRPFFAAQGAGPQEALPPPPSPAAFDRAILDLCGEWGSRPARSAFRQVLDLPEVARDVAAMREELGSAVRGPRLAPADFADELTALWFAEDGFRHVFCGEPGEARLGGMHFKGRFLQMQQRGWGGLASCRSTEIDPPIFTIGVEYVTPSGQRELACPKSYSIALDARGLLTEATKAFREKQVHRAGETMCLHRVMRPESRSYYAVLVSRAGAIRTFYPHASPSCDTRAPPESCLCAG
jgi:hypothetical protein